MPPLGCVPGGVFALGQELCSADFGEGPIANVRKLTHRRRSRDHRERPDSTLKSHSWATPADGRVGRKRTFASDLHLRAHLGATAQSRLVIIICRAAADFYLLTLSGNRRLSQFVEQRLSLFEIGGIEAFGKPAEDRGEQCHRLLLPALSSA